MTVTLTPRQILRDIMEFRLASTREGDHTTAAAHHANWEAVAARLDPETVKAVVWEFQVAHAHDDPIPTPDAVKPRRVVCTCDYRDGHTCWGHGNE